VAAFTSTTDGDWNDGATWGNTSPGTKGVDWPGIATDTATIASGTTVTYNVSETNALGAVTIDGKLIASRSMSTLLAVGNVDISIGATGELDFGTEVSPIPKAHTCEISINSTSDNSIGIKCADGGKYSICGDSTYITNRTTTLANNAENTDSDNIIITNDNLDGDWHVGDDITIQQEYAGDSSSHNDAVLKATITGISGTEITVDVNVTGMVAGVGDTWISRVENVTHNVKVYKAGAATTIGSYNTNRPLFLDSTTGSNTNILSNCQITGFYRITANGATFTNCTVRNGERGFYYSNNNTISGNIYSCYHGLYSSNNNTISGNIYSCYHGLYSSNNNTISGNIYSCNYGLSSSNNNTISGNIYSCNYGLSSSNNNTISGNIYSCNYGLSSSNNNTISGKLGYDDGDNSLPNTYDLRYSTIIMSNCKQPLAGLAIYDLNIVGGASFAVSDHDNRVLNSHKTYRTIGNIIKTTCDGTGTSPSEDPDGGNGDCIEVSNLQSNLSTLECIPLFNDKGTSIYCTASVEKTFTYKMQSIFTNTLANTEVILEAYYMAGADGALTRIASTGTIAARTAADDWTQSLSVTLTPIQTGFVFFQIRLCKYESGKKLYVYPTPVIT
jgi:hypothetical protein